MSLFSHTLSLVQIFYFKFPELLLLEINCSHFGGLVLVHVIFWIVFCKICYECFCFELVSTLGIVEDVREGVFYNSFPFYIKTFCLRLDYLYSAVLVSRTMQFIRKGR